MTFDPLTYFHASNGRTEKKLAPVLLPPPVREHIQTKLQEAFEAFQSHTGYTEEYWRSFDELENAIAETINSDGPAAALRALPRDDAEASITHAANVRVKVSISQLVRAINEVFARKVMDNAIPLPEVASPFSFLPTEFDLNPRPKFGEPQTPPQPQPNLARVLSFLHERGVVLSDIVIINGTLRRAERRIAPYHIVKIPHLDREIAVSDQSDQPLFISKGLQSLYFWAIHGADQVRTQEGIVTVLAHSAWDKHLSDALFKNTQPQPRTSIDCEKTYRASLFLSDQVLLVAALKYARRQFRKDSVWRLPSDIIKIIPELPGRNWHNIAISIERGQCGLPKRDLIGLVDFFNFYGLKQGRSVNPGAVEKAWTSYLETGRLALTHSTPKFTLTEDMILIAALKYAVTHHDLIKAATGKDVWKLPNDASGTVADYPGHNWHSWSIAIRGMSNGFPRPGMMGLPDFLEHYGLKYSQQANPVVVKQAWNTYLATGHHGLSYREDRLALTEDLILICALKHAHRQHQATGKWRLPSDQTNDVIDCPGQFWHGWSTLLRRKQRGLTREGLSGIFSLFAHYGLKLGPMANNEPVIAEAAARVIQGQPHGLTFDPNLKIKTWTRKLPIKALSL